MTRVAKTLDQLRADRARLIRLHDGVVETRAYLHAQGDREVEADAARLLRRIEAEIERVEAELDPGE